MGQRVNMWVDRAAGVLVMGCAALTVALAVASGQAAVALLVLPVLVSGFLLAGSGRSGSSGRHGR